MSDKYLCDTCGCDENHYEAIERIREIHKPDTQPYGVCVDCDRDWPCVTIQAIEGGN